MPTITTAPSVLIRAARGSDGPALQRLAVLDSADVPTGDLLVGEADGTIVAARSVSTGAVIADPFRRTADVVALLDVHAAAQRAPRTRRHQRGLTRRLRVAAHSA
jgi:hypothetical protein